LGQYERIVPTELQYQRLFVIAVLEQSRRSTETYRVGNDHLGIEPCVRRDESMKCSTVPISPRHHGRDTQKFVAKIQPVSDVFHAFCSFLLRFSGMVF